MKKEKWIKYLFEDGHVVTARKLSALELAAEKRKHGNLIEKREIWV